MAFTRLVKMAWAFCTEASSAIMPDSKRCKSGIKTFVAAVTAQRCDRRADMGVTSTGIITIAGEERRKGDDCR